MSYLGTHFPVDECHTADLDVIGKHGVWKVRDLFPGEIADIALIRWGSSRIASLLHDLDERFNITPGGTKLQCLVIGVDMHDGGSRVRLPCFKHKGSIFYYIPTEDHEHLDRGELDDPVTQVPKLVEGWHGPDPDAVPAGIKPDAKVCLACDRAFVRRDLIMMLRRIADRTLVFMHTTCVFDGVGIGARAGTDLKLQGVSIHTDSTDSDVADTLNQIAVKIAKTYTIRRECSDRFYKKRWKRLKPEVMAWLVKINSNAPALRKDD